MTPVNCFAISLLAVTFGWAPVEPSESAHAKPALPTDAGRASGYEYHVRVSPTDLDDLRAGRVDSLSSHLPDDVGPIERVRITFGEGPAPRQLTAVDRRKTKPASETQRYVVAKPATPEWGPAPKRHVAYQNPNELTLQQGFEEAARSMGYDQQQAEQWVRNQAQEMTDSAVDSGIQLTQAYVGSPPGSTQYGGRPTQTNNNPGGANGYGVNETVTPPAPTSVTNNTQPGQTNYGNTNNPQYNTSTTPNYNPNQYSGQNNGGAGSTQIPLPPPPTNTTPVQPLPRSSASNGFERNPYNTNPAQGPQLANPQGSQVLQRFTNDSETYGPTGRSNVTPVQPRPTYDPTLARTSNPGYSADYPKRDGDIWGGGARAGDTGYASSQGSRPFPEREPIAPPALDRSTARGQSPPASYTSYEREREREPDGYSRGGDSWLTGRGDSETDLSRERDFARRSGAEEQASVIASDSGYFEKLMMVILCGVTFFTWTAYIDIRNKYRAALRGAPTVPAGGLAA